MSTPTHDPQPVAVNRVLSGVPAGGQFAGATHPETGTVLTAAVREPRPRDRSVQHAALADRGVGAGTLSLLAPVEARSVLASLPELGADDRAAVRTHVASYLRWRDLCVTSALHPDRARQLVAESTRQLAAAKVGFADMRDDLSEPPEHRVLAAEAENDLAVAVRRFDAAAQDLKYLTNPSWRPERERRTVPADGSLGDEAERTAAHRRASAPGYRGQLH